MQNSIWKLAVLAGVVGVGFLVVLQAQRGMTPPEGLEQALEVAEGDAASQDADGGTTPEPVEPEFLYDGRPSEQFTAQTTDDGPSRQEPEPAPFTDGGDEPLEPFAQVVQNQSRTPEPVDGFSNNFTEKPAEPGLDFRSVKSSAGNQDKPETGNDPQPFERRTVDAASDGADSPSSSPSAFSPAADVKPIAEFEPQPEENSAFGPEPSSASLTRAEPTLEPTPEPAGGISPAGFQAGTDSEFSPFGDDSEPPEPRPQPSLGLAPTNAAAAEPAGDPSPEPDAFGADLFDDEPKPIATPEPTPEAGDSGADSPFFDGPADEPAGDPGREPTPVRSGFPSIDPPSTLPSDEPSGRIRIGPETDVAGEPFPSDSPVAPPAAVAPPSAGPSLGGPAVDAARGASEPDPFGGPLPGDEPTRLDPVPDPGSEPSLEPVPEMRLPDAAAAGEPDPFGAPDLGGPSGGGASNGGADPSPFGAGDAFPKTEPEPRPIEIPANQPELEPIPVPTADPSLDAPESDVFGSESGSQGPTDLPATNLPELQPTPSADPLPEEPARMEPDPIEPVPVESQDERPYRAVPPPRREPSLDEGLTPTPLTPEPIPRRPRPSTRPEGSGGDGSGGDGSGGDGFGRDGTVRGGLGRDVVGRDAPRGPQQPQLKIEKIAPKSAVLGRPLVYDIVVRNVGDSTAHQVTVEDRVPKGVELNGTRPQAELSGNRLLWKLGELKPGEHQKISIRVVPKEEGSLGSVATVNFVAEVAATTRVTAPKLELEFVAPEKTRVGRPVQYVYRIKNTGSGDADGVILRTLIPDELTHPGGRDLEYDVGTLPAGKSKDVRLKLTASQIGDGVSTAIITAKGGYAAEKKVDLVVLGPALKVERKGPKQRYLGRPGTFENHVTNESEEAIEGVTVVETIPQGMEFVKSVPQGRFDPSRRTVVWQVASLPAGETRKYTVTLRAKEQGEMNSIVQVVDRVGQGSRAQSTTTVEGFSSMGLEVPSIDRPLTIGQQVTVRVAAKNRGTSAASTVGVTIDVPDEMELVAAKGPSKHTQTGNQVQFAALETIDAGKHATYQVVMRARRPGDARLRVQVESSQTSKPVVQEQPILILPDGR